MGNNAKDILAKYERENEERVKSGNVNALKDSEGRFLRNKKTGRLIKRKGNPILDAIIKIIMILIGVAFLVWIVFSIIAYFNDFKNYTEMLWTLCVIR